MRKGHVHTKKKATNNNTPRNAPPTLSHPPPAPPTVPRDHSLRRQPKAAERVNHLADEVASAAVEEDRVPDNDVPHVDELG